MMFMLRRMLLCHWSARRIQRYLDYDPSAPLTEAEARRLEHHLAECERCARLAEEHRFLHRALSAWSHRQTPDPAAVARLRRSIDSIVAEET